MSGSIRHRPALPALAAVYSISALLSGCASVPDEPAAQQPAASEAVAAEPEAGSLSIRDSDGRLRQAAANKLIARAAADADPAWLRAVAEAEQDMTGESLWAGNRVELLVDGPATYASMFEAMRAATDHINVETYILSDDEIGRALSALLQDKARAGVVVNVIYDGIGSLTSSDKFFEELRASGVRLIEFHPPDPTENLKLWEVAHRDHRKLTIVDGRVAFVGGINFSNTYSSSSMSRPAHRDELSTGWRDTHLRIEGPAVKAFQELFLETWTEHGGESAGTAQYFPELTEVGDELVRLVASDGGDDHEFTVYRSYLQAIASARHRIWITQAYFAPTDEFIEALQDAARRGVDVKLLVPGFSDSDLLLCASRALHDDLLSAGVELYEYTAAVLHAKTAVIDGVWSTIGSSNLDMRSIAGNDEANAVVVGRRFGQQMEHLFEADLAEARPVTAATLEERGVLASVAQFFCSTLRGLL